MKYKLVGIDLDDTLLTDSLEVSKENIEALEYAHHKGVKIAIATGRATSSMLPYIHQLKFYGGSDYFISYNGGIISNQEGKILFQDPLKQEIINELIQYGREYNLAVQIYNKSDLYVEKYTEDVRHYESITKMKACVVEDLTKIDARIKLLYNHRQRDLLEQLKGSLTQKYQDQLNIFYSKSNLLEIVPVTVNKGIALKHLAEHLGVEQEEVIAIGDSFNDLFMIDYAGLGVCVANAQDEIKKHADYITRATNNESAVAEVIHKYIQ